MKITIYGGTHRKDGGRSAFYGFSRREIYADGKNPHGEVRVPHDGESITG